MLASDQTASGATWSTFRFQEVNSLPILAVPPMPKSRSSTALKEMARLRAEIRELGAALGRVITQLEGPAALATVLNLRALAKASRQGDVDAPVRLAAAVRSLTTDQALQQAMAFTVYFELVNLAEENFRVELIRRRRSARRNAADGGPDAEPVRESIEAALVELKHRGVTAAELQERLDRLSIELVFTAHPTESKRRTLLVKLRRLATLLRERTNPVGPETDARCIEQEIVSLWLTDRSRVARPEVTDEAKTGLWYFDTTLYETLPRLQ